MTGDHLLTRVAEVVRDHTGIRSDPVHSRALAAALARASEGVGVEAFVQALDSPDVGGAALARLVDEVTVKETSFLRDAEQLARIPWHDLLAGARAAGDDTVRVWSAACATGEEPYTLAMLACEAFGTQQPPVWILGTDVSEIAVARARRGCYRERAVRSIDLARRSSHLRPMAGARAGNEEWEVGAALRALVDLRTHNLVQDPAPPPACPVRFDLVLCRNVLIYFDAPVVEAVIARLEGALRPGGQLVLGAADALGTTSQRLGQLIEAGPPRRGPRAPLAPRVAAPRERPVDADDHLVLGLVALARDEPLAAMRSLRRALAARPAFSLAAFQLGRAAEAVADRGAARSAYEQALRALGTSDDRSPEPWGIAPDDLAAACRARLGELG